MDIYRVSGMFLQALGILLLILTLAMLTLTIQFGGSFTWDHFLNLAVAVGMVWAGRTVEYWKQRDNKPPGK